MGELVGLSTLSSILRYSKVLSNNISKKDVIIRKRLTQGKLHKVYELVFEHCASHQLNALLQKDKSALSRTLVTFILDDSIFRQWLEQMITSSGLSDCPFYGRYYSGQYHQVVWGYQVECLGVSIGDIFYPLYLEFVRKTPLEVQEMRANRAAAVGLWREKVNEKKVLSSKLRANKLAIQAMPSESNLNDRKTLKKELEDVNQSIKTLKSAAQKLKMPKRLPEKQEVAQKLVQKVGIFIKRLNNKDNKLLKFSLSCDNGYSNSELLQVCEQNHLNYISVPKKTHFITVDGKAQKISTYIEDIYLSEEKAYNEKQEESNNAKKGRNNETKELFMLRKRVFYQSVGRFVTLLIFRLVGSKKITAIYCTDKDIFAKTLRRHWFARTQIEQFFKLLKHYMHIQNARPRDKASFEYHLFRFAFVGLHIQKIVRILRQKKVIPKKASLEVLRVLCSPSNVIQELLKKIFENMPFAD